MGKRPERAHYRQEILGQAIAGTVARRWATGRPSFCAIGGPYSSTVASPRSSHSATKRSPNNSFRSVLDFVFLLYHWKHGTEDGHYIGVYRYGSVPGLPRFVKVCRSSGVRKRLFVLISTEPMILGWTHFSCISLPLVIWETQGHIDGHHYKFSEILISYSLYL